MTYKEAKEKAEGLQNHVGKRVGNSKRNVMIITAAPTDRKEYLRFIARIGTPPYVNIEEALKYVLTKDFDVAIVFETKMRNETSSGWASNYLSF